MPYFDLEFLAMVVSNRPLANGYQSLEELVQTLVLALQFLHSMKTKNMHTLVVDVSPDRNILEKHIQEDEEDTMDQ